MTVVAIRLWYFALTVFNSVRGRFCLFFTAKYIENTGTNEIFHNASTDDLFSGTTISRVEEEQFSVFARNSKVLQETIAKISELTTEEVIIMFSTERDAYYWR